MKKIFYLICAVIILITSANVYAKDFPGTDVAALLRRLELLETAIDRSTPETVAEQWAKAQMTRNGALEYALLSEKMRAERLSDYEGFHFFMGASSPWVESYLITEEKPQANGSYLFEVELCRTTSTRERSYSTTVITVEKDLRDAERWCVASVQAGENGGVATGLLVSVDETEVRHDVVSITDGGEVYERGTSFGDIGAEDIPYVPLGSTVQLRLYSMDLKSPSAPTAVELYGQMMYGEKVYCLPMQRLRAYTLPTYELPANGGLFMAGSGIAESIPIKFENGIASFVLEPNGADDESGAGTAVKGFRLVCEWEDKSCEYIFALRSDAPGGARERGSASLSQDENER